MTRPEVEMYMNIEWKAEGKEEPYWCDTCECLRYGPHFCPGEYDPEKETAPGVLKEDEKSEI